MPNLGIGAAPLGSSSLGFGSPAKQNSTSSRLYQGPDGVRRNASALNTMTGDIQRDAQNGIHTGMDSIQQQVYLAIRTIKGSAIVQSLGMALKVKTISETTAQKVKQAITAALADLVTRQLIVVNTITVERIKITGIRVIVTWTNLTNNETNISRWDNG